MINRVESEGSLDAAIFVIGEAPGEEEDHRGRPFWGRSGRLLMQYINRVGLLRTDVRLGNVIRERPPRNDITKFIQFNRNGRLIKATDEYLRYKEELIREVSASKANVLVACGNIPLWTLTGKYGISKWRGSILQTSPEFGSRKVIPTLHPAAIARMFGKSSGKFTHTFRMDWERIVSDSKFPELRWPQRTLHINNTYEQVMEYLHRCLQFDDLLGFDTEATRSKTTGWELSHIQFALGPWEAMCISFIEVYNGIVSESYTTAQERDILKLCSAVLQSKKVHKVGQNLRYDNYFLYRKYGIIVQNWEDTRVAHKIAYPEMPASLAYMTSVYTREPYYKDDGKTHKTTKDLTTSFQEYAAKDAAICCEIYPRISNVVSRLKNTHIYQRHIKSQDFITYAMEQGIRMNAHGVKRVREVYEARLKKLYDELQTICKFKQGQAGWQTFDVRPTAPADIAKYFYDVLRIKPYHTRRKSKNDPVKITTNEDALKRIARQGYEEAHLVLKCRRARKFISTYLNIKQRTMWAGAPAILTQRFNGDLDLVGTKQGRMSGHKNSFGEGTNPQNLPQNFRKTLCADKGHILLEIDGSQAENRTVAYIGPIPNMIRAFESGVDVHALTASFIFGIDVKQVSRKKGSSTLGDGTHSQRDWGKRGNHAFNYGFGEDAFSLKYEIPIDQSRIIRNGWLVANGGIEGYWRWVEHDINTKRMLVNPFGRTIFFMGNVGTDLYRVAYSAIPQSTVADYILERGICFFRDNSHLFGGFKPQNQVHDALWYQILMALGPKRIITCLRMMKESLERPIKWRDTEFVIPADFKIGKSYGRLTGFDPSAADAADMIGEMYWSKT